MNTCAFDGCYDQGTRHLFGYYFCDFHNREIRLILEEEEIDNPVEYIKSVVKYST